PCLWDVTFQTAVAQAELEERELSSSFIDLKFDLPASGDSMTIATTRPELLAACVALVVHPEDRRFAHLVGQRATSPLFGVEVPILAHRLADPNKGTGMAMICTFGDVTDVIWWRELGLPIRSILTKDGRLISEPAEWLVSPSARTSFQQIAGLSVEAARSKSIELLDQAGAVAGQPRPIRHAVKFYEKGDKPVEIITTRQWYIKNGAQDSSLRDQLVARGRELSWHPPHMRSRYESWIDGLSSDWLISRQRYFGVPFPLWYPLGESGEPNWQSPILPDQEQLPIDPQSMTPAGYEEAQRGQPNGFIGDPDIMDTWATSSLTPYIACGWEEDSDLFSRTFPMDMRPQAHDIIRTWLFVTVLRSELELGCLP
ncbi:MAG: class I tRNA ligase family protein, partial [Candidatus Dormibacteraceae bacterium]